MSQAPFAASQCHLHDFFDEVEYLNEATLFILLCGTLFTRLAAGVWIGDRPAVVLLTILTMVYLYMHRGRYHTMLIRFPIVLVLLFLGQTYLIHSGSFFSPQPFALSWKHLALTWSTLNFSFLFHGIDLVPAFLRIRTRCFSRAAFNEEQRQYGKIIPLRKAQRA